ncbi:MAG: pyridoxamine 5'-phosphate oxidase family protein [Pseudomonadota bacterium]
MAMFHEGNRALQDRYGGRAVADRIVEMVETDSFTDEFREFIEAVPFFFLATSANGVTDCSFKGGQSGFVRVTGPRELIFPDYDGNRMYKSLGNILENPSVGLLFMKFGAEEGQGALYLRIRVNGRASVHDDHPALASYPGAQRIVRVETDHIYPNCPRYVPEMAEVAPSRHIPAENADQPVPEWKKLPPIAELL